MWWTGSAVASSIITQTDYTLDEYNFEVVSGTRAGGNAVLRAYVTTGGSPGTNGDFDTNQFDRGGNIEEWTSAPGLASWTKTGTVVTATDTTHTFNSGALVKDYDAKAKLVYNAWLNGTAGPYNASVRLWGTSPVLPVFEAETTALLNRFSVTPSAPLQGELNGMLRVLKQAGIWTKLDDIALMGGLDAQSSRLGWKGMFNLAPKGNGGAGPAFVAGVGFTGNGTDSYHDIGLAPGSLVQFTQNDGEFGLWGATNAQAAAADCGQAFGTSNTYLRMRDVSNVTGGQINQTATVNINSVTDNTLFMSLKRTSSTAVQYMRNAVSLGTGSQASVARDTNAAHTFWVGGANLATPQFSTRPLGAFFIGASLTATQELILYRLLYSWFRRRLTLTI
jgi:hypothetical protein